MHRKNKFIKSHPIFPVIEKNIELIKSKFNQTEDISQTPFQLKSIRGVALYISTLVDEQKLSDFFLSHLSRNHHITMVKEAISASGVTELTKIEEAVDLLLKGFVVLFVEGEEKAIAFDITSRLERTIDEPENEKIIRGSHEGFIEDLAANLQLIRRRVINPNLVVKYLTVGDEAKTEVSIVYLNNIANPDLVHAVEERVKSISSDMIINLGQLNEFIEDRAYSPFPQLLITERPDRVTANVVEGRVAILLEGSPSALILPTSFFTFYQSPDDYSSRFLEGSFYRLLRLIGFFIAIFVPALYIATVSFHHEIIPADLVIPIKSSVERVPFPPFIEALIMELTIELIREAGIRLPTPIGQTIGIVGGLVIGDAVVQAGLVSNIMIIVVAITAIASFAVPSPEMNATVRMLRFPFMFSATSFGYLGISLCFIIVLIHLCKLESFGSPYFYPLAPLKFKGWGDSFVRVHSWKMKKRPDSIQPKKTNYLGRNREWQK